jgi:hypothetical protein
MSNEPPGVTVHGSVSNLFDPERERAICCLRKQARILRTAGFRAMKLELTAEPGAAPMQRWIFLLDDGRALEWFGESRPYVVHPNFTELCDMRRFRSALVHAA